MVIDGHGRQVSASALDALLPLLGMPAGQVVQTAKFGWWLQSAPSLCADGLYAEVKTAGKLLRVRLLNGSLSLG